MSGAKLGYFLLISVALTMTLFLFQTSMVKVGEEIGISQVSDIGFNYDESNIKKYDSGGYTLNADVAGAVQSLPSEDGAVDVDEGGYFFTDTLKSVKNWLLKATGIKYVLDVLNVVPSFFARMFPGEFKAVGFALGYMWYAITIFAVVFWLKGGGN
jgi:hypothetical protein